MRARHRGNGHRPSSSTGASAFDRWLSSGYYVEFDPLGGRNPRTMAKVVSPTEAALGSVVERSHPPGPGRNSRVERDSSAIAPVRPAP